MIVVGEIIAAWQRTGTKGSCGRSALLKCMTSLIGASCSPL